MSDANPEYKADVRYENGKKVLYVQILKALYGMIESALLWYGLYVTVLKEEGFVVNTVDKCVANKVINGSQCTIAWYVDDNFLAHADAKLVDSAINSIEKEFPGSVVQKGNELDFLGMEINLRDDGKVNVGTVKFLQKTVQELEEEIGSPLTKKYSTPAGQWLFKVDKKAKSLNEEQSDIFRKYVAKMLWARTRSRPDCETAMSFLMTRVHSPSKDDWHKLMRMMSFVKGTVNDVRTIGADETRRTPSMKI